MSASAPWWAAGSIYQVYPKSFQDSDDDGVGDLRGLIQRLPYIADLGVDAVWLSPIFASPMIDNGYDMADYRAINPLFGTLADFDALVAAAAARGLRIILDIALNHCATAHPWFQAALADPDGPYGDYFILRRGAPGPAPNNWRSVFGGSAWSRLGDTDRFYLHLFDASQADLNWDNPAVRAEIAAALRFWLDRGVGGFRLDVVTLISKPAGLPPMPEGDLNTRYAFLASGPNLHAYLRELRREVFAKYDCVAIGEAPGLDPARAAAVVDPADPMLDLIYHFDLVTPPRDQAGQWLRPAFKRVFTAWDQGIGPRGRNTVVLGNHDLARLVSRFGDPEAYWRESATLLLALNFTQRATPFLYQGDELGMTNAGFESLEAMDDVWAKNMARLALDRGRSPAEALAAAQAVTRDHARTPMQWTAGPAAGFTRAAAPWLAANPNAAWLSAAAQGDDPLSPLQFTRRLIALRKADPLWAFGAMEDLAPDDPAVFAYRRSWEGRNGLVALNMSSEPAPCPCPLPEGPPHLANYPEPGPAQTLRPWEARIYG